MREDALIQLAAAVADSEILSRADGAPADSEADRDCMEQLRIIAEIATVHRNLLAQDPDRPALLSHEAQPSRTERRWGSLVVQEVLGRGTFGDVFRAWDTSLERVVALKLLKSRIGGADSILREGQLLARVKHANVMDVYGAQVIDGQVGVWGELLHGRTLHEVVQQDGPFSAAESLVVADAMCRALAAVHQAGLLHRDVKAQNVMREKGGRIVLMDFGLGRPLDAVMETGSADLAGTPLYLAPELFAGGRATQQSDVYSLGVLLFHLLTGSYPVGGHTVADISEAHRKQARTQLRDLRPELPTSVAHLVDRALEPDPGRRYATAGELHAAVTSALQPAAVDTAAVIALARSRRRWRVAALVGAVSVGALAVFVASFGQPPAKSLLLTIEPPQGQQFSDSTRNMPAISPDGRMVAMALTDIATGRIHLWVHSLETARATRVPNSERALAPLWSPDGHQLGFFEPGGVLRITTPEGVPGRAIDTGQEPRGASISASGVVIFPRGPRSGLYRTTLTGSPTVEPVIALDTSRGDLGYMWPQFLSDGVRFTFFLLSNDSSRRGIYLGSLDGESPRLLVNGDASGIISRDRLLFARDGALVAQGFNARTERVEGAPWRIVDSVEVTHDWRSVVTASSDGTLAFLPATDATELVWIDRSGTSVERLGLPVGRYRSPALSRDGRLLAVQRYHDGLSEIYVAEVPSGRARSTIAHSAEVQFPVWGPGHRLAYASIDDGRSGIYTRDFATDDVPRLLYGPSGDSAGADLMPTDWSPDGEHLVYVEFSRERPYGVWTLPLDLRRPPFPIRPGEGSQVAGHLSPDGRRIAYVRRVQPQRPADPPERELWVSDFPSGYHPRLIAQGGIDPAWPSNGQISFFDRRATLNVVSPEGASAETIQVGVRTPEASRNNYVWSGDGRQLLVNRTSIDPVSVRVSVLVNPPSSQSPSTGQ